MSDNNDNSSDMSDYFNDMVHAGNDNMLSGAVAGAVAGSVGGGIGIMGGAVVGAVGGWAAGCAQEIYDQYQADNDCYCDNPEP